MKRVKKDVDTVNVMAKREKLPEPALIVCSCGALIVASSKEYVERAKQHHFDNDRCDRETFNGWTIHGWQRRLRPVND